MPTVLPDPGQSGSECDLQQIITRPGQSGDAFVWNPLIESSGTDGVFSGAWYTLLHSFPAESYPIVTDLHELGDGTSNFRIPSGFRLGVNLLTTPSVGDFLSRSQTLLHDSIALLPAGSASQHTGWQGSHRPVVGGAVDLITGLPLLQMTDLELDFGGATFRLNRTRSGYHSIFHSIAGAIDTGGDQCEYQLASQDRWWSWTGLGWMTSENPILLIDSAVPDLVGPHPRTTWLILDAHRAIPFQQVNLAQSSSSEPRIGYEAPPRFRARMAHNGTWGAVPDPFVEPGQPPKQIYGWIEPPTQYEVWLYDGAVKYTFAAIREDVPPKTYDTLNRDTNNGPAFVETSYHDIAYYPSGDHPGHDPWAAAANPGFGIPYYAVCTRIEDRFGNRAELFYCPVERSDFDDPDTEDCVECQTRSLRKGQLNRIELQARDDAGIYQTEWTLLYVHRYFAHWRHVSHFPEPGYPDWPHTHPDYEPAHLLGANAIDRIFVYHGSPSGLPGDFDCLEIPADDRPYAASAIDPMSDLPAVAPPNWIHEVRYHYRTQQNSAGSDPELLQYPPVLIQTSVTSRHQDPVTMEPVQDSDHTRHNFYRYTDSASASAISEPIQDLTIERVYTDDDYRRLMYWSSDVLRRTHSPQPDDTAPSASEIVLANWLAERTPQQFAKADYNYGFNGYTYAFICETHLLQTDSEAHGLLLQAASYRIKQRDGTFVWPTGEDSGTPKASDVVAQHPGYVLVPKDIKHLAADIGQGVVEHASIRESGGIDRHYRFHRLVLRPTDDISPWSGDPPFGIRQWDWNETLPQRSTIAHPYRWRSASSDSDLSSAPNLAHPRWITIVDEFVSREDMLSGNYYSGPYATKPGQVSRRVVKMNATGYVLSDKLWEFTDDDVLVSGGGLGEQYIYERVGVLRPEIENELLAQVSHSDPNLDPNDPDDQPIIAEQKLKQIESFLNELLLVERRSVGWSAAELAGTKDTEGLIHFFEYDWADDTSTGDVPPIPWRSRIQKVAEGVKQGKSGTKYYTLQTFYDEYTPTDPVATVQFLTPNPAKLADYDQLDPIEFAVHRTVIYRSEPSGEDDLPVTEWPVKRRLQVGPPRHLRPDNADWYYPVQAQFFDPETGLSEWSAEGLVKNWSMPASGSNDPLERLIFTYTSYEGGQLKCSVVDAVANASLASSHGKPVEVPDWPVASGWSRLPASGSGDPALEYVTYYEYNGSMLTDIYFPNGRRWARREVIVAPAPEEPINPQHNRVAPGNDPCDVWDVGHHEDPWFLRVFIFNDLEWNDSISRWVARSAGEVHEYPGLSATGQPTSTKRVEFLSGQDPNDPENCTSIGDAIICEQFLLNRHQKDQPYFIPLAEKRVLPDQYGKLTDARIFERNVDGVLAPVGFQQINDLGEVFRTRDIDGTITRVTRNSIGQNLRRYVGTIDDEWVFPEDPQNPPPGGLIAQNHRNNLVLVERTEYGISPNDAWQPTIVRTYNTNQSFQDNWHWYPYDAPPESDPHGQATRTRYDWRMRPVRVDVYAQGDPNTGAERLSTTLTVLDHADRTRFTVTYGPGSTLNLAGLDPTQFGPNPSIPSAADFIQGAGLRPLSVVEMIYGTDGQMTERRDYDVSWDGVSSEPPFHADFQYTGFGGQTVFQQRPNTGVQISDLDGLGRVISSATVVPRGNPIDYDLEVARTDYVYDEDNNVKEVHRWERVVDAASMSPADEKLDFNNAVRSTTLNWHDVQNRLVATAELGTQREGFISDGNDPQLGWNFDPTERPEILPDTQTINRQDVPYDIPLTIYSYDRDGNQDFVAQTIGDGSSAEHFVTRYTYTGLKRVASKIENYFGPPAEQRRTDYVYRFGRLAEIIADPDSSGTALQHTVVDFGADDENDWGAEVVDVGPDNTGWTVASRHGEYVRALRMPSLSTANEASTTSSIFLRYDFQGRVAERIDARGIAIRYRHDELGRLASLEVGHYDASAFVSGYPTDTLLPGLQAPSDRIGYIEYTYHDDTRSFEAKAWTKKSGGILISHNKVEFDDRGDLASDWQSIGLDIGVSTPRTSYTWDTRYTTTGVAGHRRLGTMLYPAPPLGPPSAARTVSFHYGVADSLDDALSRLTSITTNKGPVAEIARFGHIGSGRRAWMSRGDDRILQGFGLVDDPASLSTGIGLHGLDRFGRVTELAYNERTTSGSTGPSLINLEYEYDLAGNRTRSVRTPRLDAPSPTDTLDETNTYDPFNRLVAWLTEHTGGSGTSFVRADDWDLDLLGNWIEREVLNGSDPAEYFRHTPDARNRIAVLVHDSVGSPAGNTEPIYDGAGNLIFDGGYAYQYDAWNRLVQVNTAVIDTIPHQDPLQGEIEVLVVGELIKHHTYDALGRLARTQSPHPDPQTSSGQLRSERFYYDGVRRIQEVFVDPLEEVEEAMGDPQGSSLVLQTVGAETYELDGKSAPAVFEMAQTGEDDEEPGDPGDPGTPDRWLDREYIWGPGDRGLDELLVQYDRHALPSWPVQDQGNDAIALLDLGGIDGAPRVVAEWVYDPYGKVVATDTIFQDLPSLRLGHKGLFVDRLDAAVDAPRLTTNARILYHNRNRTLHPDFGRFLQKDPNATAMVLIGTTAYNGAGLTAGIGGFDLESRYGDGANLYGYLDGNPWTRSDPLGLFYALGTEMLVGGLRGGLHSMIGEYAANQEWDVEWALDWSMGDDWHSRGDNSWVGEAWSEGLRGGVHDAFWGAVDPFSLRDHFAMGAASSVTRTLRRGYRQQDGSIIYKAIRRGHLHHVWPRYLARLTGTDSIILARLPRNLHQKYHLHVSRGMQAGRLKTPHMTASKSQWDRWFNKQMRQRKGTRAQKSKAIFDDLSRELERLTRQFERSEDIKGLVSALRESLDLAR